MEKRKVTNNVKLHGAYIIIAILFFVVLIVRMGFLSLSKNIDGINIQEFASKRTNKTDILYAKRGTIYDINGNVLAQNVSSYTIVAYLSPSRTTNPSKPKHVVDKEMTAKKLSEILDISYDKILSLLSKENIYQTEFGSKGKGLTQLTKEKIESLNLPGIDFIETQKRNYPYGRFLSYTLGYARTKEEMDENGKSEEKIVGELGIESKFDKDLSGTDGYNFYQKDRNGYKIAGTKEQTVKAIDGKDIYLTIDSSIQLFVEQAMSKVSEKYKSDWITMMVADGKTGAILASSTYPSFDPNVRDIKNYLDYNVSYSFEPGSTMKIFSYMAAIEKGVYNGDEKYKSGVYKTTDGTEIGDWSRNGWGTISFDKGFALSSNVAVINLIKKHIGRDYLMDFYKKLGFGSKTGIELANEASGKINFKYETEVFNAGFGQGITTTSIQNIKSLTSISNNGVLLKPYIIDKIVDPDNNKVVYQGSKQELSTVVSEKTVSKIKDLMEKVVNGTSQTSTGYYYYMDGYNIIAKTGTAQVPKENGKGYYSNQTIRGFAGMFPKDNPQVIIYLAVKNPSNTKLLKELVQEVIKNTSNYLNIYDESKQTKNKLSEIVLPSFVSRKVEDVKNELSKDKINTFVIGNGDIVINQYPVKGTKISNLDRIFLITNSNTDLMPSFIGLSKSEAQVLAEILNVNIKFDGEGYVSDQNIKEGTKIDKSKILELKLNQKK